MRKIAFLSLLFILGCSTGDEYDFDGEAALRRVKTLLSHGQRVSGSRELEKAGEYIFSSLPETVKRRIIEFEDMTPEGVRTFRNIEAVIPAADPAVSGGRFIIVSGHYDLKKLEPPMAGANDSGSSAAVLIELARTIKPSRCEIRIVWFDGEECLRRYSENDGLHGSRNYAAGLSADELKNCIALINIDMVGDRDLNYTLSADTSLAMVKTLMKAAEKTGVSDRITQYRGNILDDDRPFRELGVPCVNLIDFDYDAWHTPEDDLSRISAESLAVTGSLVLAVIDELQNASCP
ncbi:MAG: M28 family metallopeptidase [Victivallaceae bacterium]|nr:M28 family metallopeptidase [Victivallaceae bacterium]